MSETIKAAPFWQRFDVLRIEDLDNLVLGSGVEAIQMQRSPVRGSLAFGARDGIIFSSALINSRVVIRGTLSRDGISLVMGLRFGPGSRLWLNEVEQGVVGAVQAGHAFDALFTGPTLLLAATLSADRLQEEASRLGISFDHHIVQATGFHRLPLSAEPLQSLRSSADALHRDDPGATHGSDLGCVMLRALLEHYCFNPTIGYSGISSRDRGEIFGRALAFILRNLSAAITLDGIAQAAETSPEILLSVFREFIDETPDHHIRRCRLHRIRRDLCRPEAHSDSIAAIADRWGIHDEHRMAAWYQHLFRETPKVTRLALMQRRQDEWM
ncbi:helix-turn-helix domain-containing protein [Labrys okinawensis]|uniref:helix-turn-helix domain-containing protein n=1 Tax=Labrys okinawensis TaxID=346911 RepID=UPI0039BCE720